MRITAKKIRHTNYISSNPLLRLLLNNFINTTINLLESINPIENIGLDAGCGEGHMLNSLYQQNVLGKLFAVDINMADLIFARKQFPYYDYYAADLCNLPFKNDTFDYIISTEVFEHLPRPENAMVELKRVSKPSAYLIISVPFEPFFHWGNLIRGKYWTRGGYTPDHKSLWNRHQFKTFLTKFVEIEIEFGLKTFPWLLYGCRFK